MLRAEYKDKPLVVNILAKSFDDNRSVNYIIPQDSTRQRRVVKLMEYSFDYCSLFGEVYLSEEKKACALLVLPDKKKATFKSIMLDVKLALSCVGLFNLKKTLAREAKIKNVHPKSLMYYLWFIGVQPGDQHKGLGSSLLKELIARGDQLNRPMYLETSTLINIPWYKKFGFQIYEELDIGYKLFCLKREI
jgi:ribosomal protein S18 acetylase RimI-like enzyme